MEDKIDRIEEAVAEMRTQMAIGFAGVDEQLAAVRQELRHDIRQGDADTRSQLSAQIESVRQELRQELRQGDADTRSQLGAQIESVRDDVRIFAEAHVALEQRVTRIEHRQG